ncbi:MAG: hypothetical protein KAX77_03595 [Xanthomonadales bacterium]|nr:hypothetical protein [Xanthomonadales bacterium]
MATYPDPIDLTLPGLLLPTPNDLLRMERRHWSVRRNFTMNLARMVWATLFNSPHRAALQRDAIKRCRILIERHSAGRPDPDAIKGCAKPLLDVLQPRSKRHPYGLGVIADDSDAVIEHLDVRHVQAKRGTYAARIVITPTATKARP